MNDPMYTKLFLIIWGVNIMPKWKIFLWKLWHNDIAINLNPSRRNIRDTTIFPACLHIEEDLSHLFLFCPLAEEVWHKAYLIVIISFDPHLNFRKWLWNILLHFSVEDGYNGSILSQFVGVLWAIWTTRNEQVFHQRRTTS